MNDNCWDSLDCANERHARGMDELEAINAELYAALESMLAIVGDSRGVSGYHLNGDVAEWDEFQEVSEAIAALAKARGER